MSFNRIKYDTSAYDLQMNRSTDTGDYRLFAPFAENCNQCLSYDGPIGSKSDVSLVRENMDLSFKDMAETESQLSWRRQYLSKNNKPLNNLDENNLKHKPVCTSKLTPEDTRFTHPIDDFRSMSYTPLMMSPYLPVNPQCHFQSTDDLLGLNSRLFSKDNYKLDPVLFLDNGSALPREEASKPVKNTSVYMSNY